MRFGEGFGETVNMYFWRYIHVLLPRLLPGDYSIFENTRRHIFVILTILAEPLHQKLGLPLGHGLVKDGVLYLVSIIESRIT